jgi:predicted amidohydrolase
MRIAIAQITSNEDVEGNLQQIIQCLDQIKEPIDLFCLPENSLFLRVQKSIPVKYFTLDELAQSSLQKKVNELGYPVLITTPILDGNQRCNGTVVLGANKLPELLYKKIHLFDVDVPGAPPVRESDNFESGSQPIIWQLGEWKVGLTICYDLRFAELFLYYAKAGVDVVLVPSAFLVPTGEAHWHTLLRARAIEGQFYVAAPAQAGTHTSADSSRQTFGHSLVVDPWGRVLAEISESPAVRIVELKREEIVKVRMQIPMREHRRL